jgi:hypothetical protein
VENPQETTGANDAPVVEHAFDAPDAQHEAPVIAR